MEFKIVDAAPESVATDCLILAIYEDQQLSQAAQQVDKASIGYLNKILTRGDIQGKSKQTLLLQDVPNVAAERILLVGCGKADSFDEQTFISTVQNAITQLKLSACKTVSCYLTAESVNDRSTYWINRTASMTAHNVFYTFDQLKKKKEDSTDRKITMIHFAVANSNDLSAAELGIRDGEAIGKGMSIKKDLANLPGNICTPTYIAEQAEHLGKQHKKIKTVVLSEKDMDKLGMGSLLSVSKGSRQPAKLISIDYRGGDKNEKPIVIIGKGVTFDSGGLSLKPPAAMIGMKYDMCGAACTIATLNFAAEMELPLNIVGIIPTTENLPGGEATKPGDIVTSMSGQTIEILNTDAEGRLILCDAITYSERFNPELIIDLATLTGAIVISLGHEASGVFSNDDELAKEILEAGLNMLDRAWQFPIWKEYDKMLDCQFADMKNIAGREAESITAACFLSRFVPEGVPWAHLDIAGSAFLDGSKNGATGRPVPLLCEFLLNRCRDKA